MTPRITIADDSFKQIRDHAVGIRGVEVEDQQHAGVKFVLMTVDGYQQLRQLVYDDSDLTPDEMLAEAEMGLNNPEGWSAEGIDDYEKGESLSCPLGNSKVI